MLQISLNNHEYKFTHVGCFCSGHCAHDNFYVDETLYLINDNNSELCWLMQLMFKNDIHLIVRENEQKYKIFLDKEDVEEDNFYLLFFNMKDNIWEYLPPNDSEEYSISIKLPQQASFLIDYCNQFLEKGQHP